MNFLDAKAIISPDKQVIPGSKEHDDILRLMRQTRVFPEDNVPAVPILMTTLMPLKSRIYVDTTPKPVSKKSMVQKPSRVTVPIEYEFAEYKPGMSKKQFMKIKRNLNIENASNGRREEVEASIAPEGRQGENQESS